MHVKVRPVIISAKDGELVKGPSVLNVDGKRVGQLIYEIEGEPKYHFAPQPEDTWVEWRL